MKEHFETLASHEGVVAVALFKNEEILLWNKGTDISIERKKTWQEVFQALRDLLVKTSVLGEEELRVTLEGHTLTALRSGDLIVGVATLLGHPIAKSLRRLLRRTFSQLSTS